MADTPDKDQKTETPTPKKRADAARSGDILQSRELGTALVMTAGSAWLWLAGPWFVKACLEMLRSGLSLEWREMREFDATAASFHLIGLITVPLISLFLLAIGGAIIGPVILGSSGFRMSAVGVKASRLNPLSGLARIFGRQGVTELGKAMAKAALLGCGGYLFVTASIPLMLGLGAADMPSGAHMLGNITVRAVMMLSVGLVIIAGIDVPLQMMARTARLRMTKNEIKEESRQSDGAPELKQAVRQRQHEILNNSARKAVAQASVILTNPSHFAVALRYLPGKDLAPVVVARGRDEIALAMKTLGKENAVPILEYPKLARALYFTTRTGQPIAEDLYIAVAAILSFVFNIERAMRDGISPPDVIVPPEKSFDETGKRTSS